MKSEEPPVIPPYDSDENLLQDDNVDEQEDESDEEEVSLGDFDEQAFRALDAQLDQLNSALDALEEKNDRIHEKAKDLLQSNREVRATSEGSNEAMDQDHGDDSK